MFALQRDPSSKFWRWSLSLVSLTIWNTSSSQAESTVEFNRDIRPILSNNCFACHGPDAQKRQAGLRLDLFENATHPADSGTTAIVPGDAAKSELVRRIFASHDEQMPPADTNKKLTPDQK